MRGESCDKDTGERGERKDLRKKEREEETLVE